MSPKTSVQENNPQTPSQTSSTSPTGAVNSSSESTSKKLGWLTLFLEPGGGLWISYTRDAQNNSMFAVQDVFSGTAGVGFHLLDGCQRSSSTLESCGDLLLRMHFGGRYAFTSQFPAFQAFIGIEGDWYFGHQRYIALTSKADVGIAYGFPKEDNSDIPVEHRINPQGWREGFLFSGGLGILINPFIKKGIGLGISLDTRFFFDGGRFGFLAVPGLRYRF